MQNRQIDNKTTKQIRIDAGLHQLLKVYASKSGVTIKALLEDYLSDLLSVDKDEVYKLKVKNKSGLEKQNENITQPEQNRTQESVLKTYQKPTKTEQNHSESRARNTNPINL